MRKTKLIKLMLMMGLIFKIKLRRQMLRRPKRRITRKIKIKIRIIGTNIRKRAMTKQAKIRKRVMTKQTKIRKRVMIKQTKFLKSANTQSILQWFLQIQHRVMMQKTKVKTKKSEFHKNNFEFLVQHY